MTSQAAVKRPMGGNLSYYETVKQNGFTSVVTLGVGVGVLAAGGNGGGGGGGGGGKRGGRGGGPEGTKTEGGVTCKTCEELGRQAGVKGQDRHANHCLLVPRGRQANGEVEMVAIRRCSDCFSCIKTGDGAAPAGKYGHCLDYRFYQHHQPQQRSKRNTQRNRSEDYAAFELSDVPSTDDYDAYRSRMEAGNSVMAGGEKTGGGAEAAEGGIRGGRPASSRRLRSQQCRISSPRGLTSRRRVIRLLVAVVTIFALCVLPFHLRNLLHYWNVYQSTGGIFDFLSPIASVMMYLNCGLNPFIYWMFSDHFRRSLKDTLCFWKRSRKSGSRLALHSPRQLKTSLLKHAAM